MADPPQLRFLPTKLVEWLDLAVKAGAIFAAGFAIHQYLQARQDARVAETMRFVSEMRDSEAAAGRSSRRLSEVLWKNLKQIEQFASLLQLVPFPDRPKIRRDFLAKLIIGTKEAPGIRDEIFEVVSFFEALHICISARLCDRDTAIAFFGDYARVFWQNFEVYLTDQREVVHDFAVGLELMSRWASPGLVGNGGAQ
jgi:hypothetical protein